MLQHNRSIKDDHLILLEITGSKDQKQISLKYLLEVLIGRINKSSNVLILFLPRKLSTTYIHLMPGNTET
jgi:hypothetical protein